MRYLCLICYEEANLDRLSQAEYDELCRDALEYVEVLRRGGHYISSDALMPAKTATTLRVRDGRVSMTDGPFAETKEQLGGFFLIEAKDLNEAVRLASQIPPARLGSIEVRPVKPLT